MVDSWEDLDDGALDDEMEMLEAMFPSEYEKLSDRKFRLSLVAVDVSGSVPCVFECEVPDDYPAVPPICTINLEVKDHLAQKRLEHECEAHLQAFAEERTGAACLSGLVDCFGEAIRDLSTFAVADEESTQCTSSKSRSSTDFSDVSAFSPSSRRPTEDEILFDFEKGPPPGELVAVDAKYQNHTKGMQGFSARTSALSASSALGYRTADGGCITMANPGAHYAKWGLLGDGPMTFAELEVGMVRTGHQLELMLGVTATAPEKADLRYLHQIDRTVLVALDAQAPWLSLGYQDGELFTFSDSEQKRGTWLQPSDRLGVWYSGGELRLLRNSEPLLRICADLGPQVTLMVLLMGRVVQLTMHVPKDTPTASFNGLKLQGSQKLEVADWMTSDDCAHLRPLW